MSFADSFWTHDYSLGHRVLFEELYEGVKENEDFVALFTKRMDLEAQYGFQLESARGSTKQLSSRHNDVDYVSTIKNAYAEISANFARQGGYHLEIAANIKEMVLEPFVRWCKEHEQRVGYLELVIMDKFKHYSSLKANLEKSQKKYFNKCRMVEEFKSHYTDEELAETLESSHSFPRSASQNDEDEDEDASKTYTFGGAEYSTKDARRLLIDIISHVELTSHKVPILGTYHNVSTGSAITQWLLDNMPEMRGHMAKAEAFGQDLISNGFIRLIGSMSANKSFINSSQFLYQWKPAVFDFTKLSEFDLSKTQKNAAYDPLAALASRTNQFSNYFEDVKQAIGVPTVDYNDLAQYPKLVEEVKNLDNQYFQSTKELDKIRCEFEETVMDHLTFMQKCELDRMKAVKKAMFDFMATFSNKVSALKLVCDELFLVEETINPAGDLKFLIENYATGKFQPHVTLYDNYYNSNINQTFGVDLNVKARLDKKAVPMLIQASLSHLDSIYPELADDEERVDLWTKPVHLSKVHELRFRLNELKDLGEIHELLNSSDPMTVTNVLKLYFMELPDSIVPHSYFDLIKTLYQTYPVGSKDEGIDKTRITGLQNTLVELPVCNLATLDAILTHLNRLVQIISSKNESLSATLKSRLCKEFGTLVLRPKRGTTDFDGKSVHSFTVATETLQQNFISDLFTHKDSIFGELRRRNSKKPRGPLRTGSSSSTGGERTLTPKASVAQSSKARMESRLKNAVRKISDDVPEEAPASSNKREQIERPVTPPPPVPSKSSNSSPGKSATNLLKRSTSPNKKKLNTLLDQTSSKRNIVSSRPAKKDVIYSSTDSSESEFSKPQFAPGLERKTSVKDLASRYESPSPTPSSKKSGNGEVIVVD